MCRISMGYLYEIFPHFSPPSSEGTNFPLWPHPHWPVMSGDTSLQGNSRKGTGLLAGNCSISLTESEEKINVSHKFSKMFKLLQKALFMPSCIC